MTEEIKTAVEKKDFIRTIIEEDLKSGKHKKIHTRFPPEPNGYLHIGHAKAICLDFGLAEEYDAQCNLRFDDTNPEAEEEEYIDSIKEDLRWLGFEWNNNEFFASDYYDQLFEWALVLVKDGKAYVDDQNIDEIRKNRGSLTEPGVDSPFRNRSVKENLDLFNRMKEGEFADGEKVLRAKIDMASPNMNMRDPIIYRIKKVAHQRTGDKWCIYPMYDFTHGLSDAIEGITHSLCTLEFEDHRPLYDWFLDQLPIPSRPRQIEFSRLNISYTVLSKRKLLTLVEEGIVKGWDDPRMPTLSGMRRRGYSPEAIKQFIDYVGISKSKGTVDVGNLEYYLRQENNKKDSRMMVVLDPLKVTITNYPEDLEEEFEIINNPEDESMGSRKIKFTREIYIERDDFWEDAPKKYHRLKPGNEVRLKSTYFIALEEIIKDENGKVLELKCTYDPESRGGNSPDGRKVRGTIHWVSAKYGKPIKVNMYERLFGAENPGQETGEFLDDINPDNLNVIETALAEPAVIEAKPGSRFQFMRKGYFYLDPVSYNKEAIEYNQIVSMKDSWNNKRK